MLIEECSGWCFAQMASFTELVILREEERVLMKIASKLNDQLNRLKVLYRTTASHHICFNG